MLLKTGDIKAQSKSKCNFESFYKILFKHIKRMVSRFLKITLAGVLSCSLFASLAQTGWEKNAAQFEPAVCYASGKVEKSSIPPPEVYRNRLKSSNQKTADIRVTYHGFTEEAKASFEAAVDIWEYLIDSDIPIYIDAIWDSLAVNVLGSCGATNYLQNFEGAPKPNTYYPIALAEKLMNEEVTGIGQPDMRARFNKNINWYLGTDGNPPSNQYDLLSTVLHEICHGLGFIGFFYKPNDQNIAGYGRNTGHHACSFDHFIEDSQKERLTNTGIFANPSADLFEAVTSENLWFDSPMYKNLIDLAKPRLYAPPSWNSGSSVYHLNDASYPAGTANSLMTHAAGLGESILDPGPHTMKMLADIGWKHIYINHVELKDIEVFEQNRKIETEIRSDFTLDTTALFLFYSKDNFSSTDTLPLVLNENTGKFEALLPLSEQDVNVSYYLLATDVEEREFTNPSFVPQEYHEFTIGPDNTPPTLSHTTPPFIMFDKFEGIDALADDNLGLDTVFVEHFLNGVTQPPFGLVKEKGTKFIGDFIFNGQSPQDGDTIIYRFKAVDSSSNKNVSTLPQDGYFAVVVEEIFDPVIQLYTDIIPENREFLSVDYTVETITGFDNVAVHSPHPYQNSGVAGVSLNFATMLKYPVIINGTNSLQFDEIVLVEPGGDGTVYGDADFWDYVIVEGSKDNGGNWLPLVDGYDSREHSVWLDAYNQNISGNNSTTEGNKDLFITRTINLTENGNFSAGDTILVRFRLFSDQLARGWGWAIDNIRIQIPVSNQPTFSNANAGVYVYPNPFTEEINISVLSANKYEKISAHVYNSYGQLVKSIPNSKTSQVYSQKIDLNNLPSGIYFVKVIGNGKIINTKKLIKRQAGW